MPTHEHSFKETKVNISNGERFITATCECGATKGYSKSQKTRSEFHRTYGVINAKPKPESKKE